MRRLRHLNIALVGPGKVGLVLGRLLVDHGEKISCVVSRSSVSARRGAKFLRCKNWSTALASIPDDTDLVFIATPHGAIQDVARELSRLDRLRFKRLAVCHASGMLTAQVLEPLEKRGATVFSFHPLQTFPRNFAPRDILESAGGIYFGVDGSPKALCVARQLARKLGGTAIEIPPGMRAFYHAACVVASNHLTTLLWILETMCGRMGMKQERFYSVFKPIIMATLRNIERTSPAEALSGPIARGGAETVARHLDAVRQFTPELISYFGRVSMETVRLASVKGSITKSQRDALMELLRASQGQPSSQQESI